MTTKRRIDWGSVAIGAVGLGLGLPAIGIEVVRNWEYGMHSGPVVAATYALFALGMAGVPAVAARKGWNTLLVLLQIGCMFATGYYGISYYADGILAKSDAAKTVTEQHQDARKGVERAERDLKTADAALQSAQTEHQAAQAAVDRIEVGTPSAELQVLATAAANKVAVESSLDRGGCKERCKKAEAAHEELLQQKAEAVTRETAMAHARDRVEKAEAAITAANASATDARSRLDRAQAKGERGTITAKPIATLAAQQFGGNAEAIAGKLDFTEPVVMVGLMLLFASLLSPSFGAIIDGFAAPAKAEAERLANEAAEAVRLAAEEKQRAADIAAVVEAKRIADEVAEQKRRDDVEAARRAEIDGRAEAERVAAEAEAVRIAALSDEELVAQFIIDRLIPDDGETRATVLHDAFKAWCPREDVPSIMKLGALLEEAGVNRRRTKAGTVYGVSLAA